MAISLKLQNNLMSGAPKQGVVGMKPLIGAEMLFFTLNDKCN